jgi:transcriptional regulator with XRE-family HTH domain
MGQALRPLTPHASGWHFLGSELRWWRQTRGLTVAQLAHLVHSSPALIAKIEKADRTPGADIMLRCDEALEASGALSRLWTFIEQHRAAQNRPATLRPLLRA